MSVQPLVSRWAAFNIVGIVGGGVQLGALAVLVHLVGMHYLTATVLAVEAAVLHNFAWHQQWTWRDRPAASARAVGARLWRFHLLNGAISVAGNLALMALFTGLLHVPVLLANALAVIACSFVNFAASETAVFRSATVAGALLVLVASPSVARAGQSPATVAAWDAYQRTLEARYATPTKTGPFFVLDAKGVVAWREHAREAGVQIVDLDPPSISGGKIHHWAGAIWVPGLTVARVLNQLEDGAGAESQAYEDVVASTLLSRDGDRLRVYMKLRRHAIVNVTYNTEHSVEYRRITRERASGRSVATRIRELDNAGEAGEREKAPGDDNGFLWRLVAFWRYEEQNGGVLIECESVSLSRAVPLLLRPIAGPIVDRIARESLEKTLVTLRRVLSAG